MKKLLNNEDILEALKSEGIKFDALKVNYDMDLTELGLDSLDFYNLLIALEEKTGATVSDEDISNLTSVNKIKDFFNKQSVSS
jgi:acyl carrier protein